MRKVLSKEISVFNIKIANNYHTFEFNNNESFWFFLNKSYKMFGWSFQNFCENWKSLGFSWVGHFETLDNTDQFYNVLVSEEKILWMKCYNLSKCKLITVYEKKKCLAAKVSSETKLKSFHLWRH
jgi:hypothetical protein